MKCCTFFCNLQVTVTTWVRKLLSTTGAVRSGEFSNPRVRFPVYAVANDGLISLSYEGIRLFCLSSLSMVTLDCEL